MQNVLILVVTIAMLGVLAIPKLANAPLWRATVTPLASIIGSGFLVLAPILNLSYGYLAPLMMLILCVTAWLFGSAIRFNIAAIELASFARSSSENRLEVIASWALAFAYVISVAYYLNLFGAFGVRLLSFNDALHAKLLTSAVFILILLVGWCKGFQALERMEQISVGIKLAIIAGLLVGLVSYFFQHVVVQGEIILAPPTLSLWKSIALCFGLIVTVQGFETSRYLGAEYGAALRIRSMRLAQIIATLIYLVYIFLLTYAFEPVQGHLEETAIIDMMSVVASILSILLIIAALSAQFSAAIADTSGSGGLVAELTKRRLAPREVYAVLVAIGLLITWTSNVFEIINYASRAFAFYYAIQSAIAAIASQRMGKAGLRTVGYATLSVLGLLITIFGSAVE